MSSKMFSAVMSPLNVTLFITIVGQYIVPNSIHFCELSLKIVLSPVLPLPSKESLTHLVTSDFDALMCSMALFEHYYEIKL